MVFHIGQPSDHVLQVMKRTGRKRTKVKVLTVTTTDGKVHDMSGQDTKTALAAMAKLKVKELTIEWWLSCGTVLTFARGREADGSGALCYRVSKIRQARPRRRKVANTSPIATH
jgi:Mg-chelatase subunit ChlD